MPVMTKMSPGIRIAFHIIEQAMSTVQLFSHAQKSSCECHCNTYRMRARLAVDQWTANVAGSLSAVSLYGVSGRNFSRIDGLYIATQARGIWHKGRKHGTR